MSGTLHVPIPAPADMRRVLPAVEACMAEILDLDDPLPLVLMQLDEGRIFPAKETLLTREDDQDFPYFLIGVDGLEECGWAGVWGQSKPPITPEAREPYENGWEVVDDEHYHPGLHAVVAPNHAPLAYALSAAVALALARETGSVVVDEYAEWIEPRGEDDYDHSPEEFLEAVRVRGEFPDILSAAQAFQDAMPAWQPIPDDEDEDQPEVSPGAKPRAGAG